jgi:hypothetical protein
MVAITFERTDLTAKTLKNAKQAKGLLTEHTKNTKVFSYLNKFVSCHSVFFVGLNFLF